MKIKRVFTKEGKSPYKGINFVARRSEMKNPDGSVVFLMDNVIVPEGWSQVATDVIAQKYFRKAGVPIGQDGEKLHYRAEKQTSKSKTDRCLFPRGKTGRDHLHLRRNGIDEFPHQRSS